MAPEVIRSERYGASADVYSLGVLVYCVAHGEEYPYAGEFLTAAQAAVGVARHGLRPKVSAGVGGALRRVIEACWHADRDARPPAEDVVRMLRDAAAEADRSQDRGWVAAASRMVWG